jgi:hypothetical protein
MRDLRLNSTGGFELKAGRAESILLGCLRGPDPETRAQVGALAEADWGELRRAAARHGVSPLLYARLGSQPSSEIEVPEGVLQALREAFLMNGARNALLFQDLAQVLTALRQDGIPVVVLKGAHLAELVYAQRALRRMGDIDLLVRRPDLARTAGLLRQMGYSWEIEDPEAWLDKGVPTNHLPPFLKPPHPRIEVHWTINWACPAPLESLWRRVRPATLGGADALVLSPADLVLHLCMHAEQDGFERGLRPLCDLSATLERYGGEIDWDCVQSTAREGQAENCVYLALRLAKELLQAPVPAAVLRALEPHDEAADWLAQASATVLAGEDEVASETDKTLQPLALILQVPAPKSFGRRMKSIFRTVFPSRERMREYMAVWHSLPLTRVRSYTCYVTRGLDWLGRGFRAARYWARHRQATADYLRKQLRKRRLRKWLKGRSRGGH